MIAPIAPIAPRRVVISAASIRRRRGGGEKERTDKTMEKMKRHIRIYLSNEKKGEESEREGVKRENRNESEREMSGLREAEEFCRSLVDDDPARPVSNRSFKRNIKINNIFSRGLLLPGRCRCVVCFCSYGSLILRDFVRYWIRRIRSKHAVYPHVRIRTNYNSEHQIYTCFFAN